MDLSQDRSPKTCPGGRMKWTLAPPLWRGLMATMKRRFQFSLKALLVATLAVACFVGGMATQRELSRIESTQRELEIEKENRCLKEKAAWLINRMTVIQQRSQEQHARDNPTDPGSQRYLPQPHPKQ